MKRRRARGLVGVGLLAACALAGSGCTASSRPRDAASSDGDIAGDAAADVARNDAGLEVHPETARPSPDAAGAADATGAADTDGAADAADSCAIASTGNWTGHATFFSGGAGGGPRTSVDALWTLASSEGCVDTYVPSGTATFRPTPGACGQISEPSTAAIDPATDGQLVIDRSSSPATYVLDGQSTWSALIGCAGDVLQPDTAGGDWARARGTFDGSVISGEIPNGSLVSDPEETIWELTRVNAEFTPPPAGSCSEPPTDHWSGTASVRNIFLVSASLTWTRVATSGCIDQFEPDGTVTFEGGCTGVTPATHVVGATDGTLQIDRSFDPPRFVMDGRTSWNATCPDTSTEEVGGFWALYNGVFDGNAFSASSMFQYNPTFEWSLQRLP